MKSEYDRTYQWHRDGNDDDIYFKNKKRDTQLSEPRMTHKRRVKLTEDNVVIGEPLLHQSIGDLKQNISTHKNLKKQSEKYDIAKIIHDDNRRKKKHLVNEAVQTDNIIDDKSTQVSKKVPDVKEHIDGFRDNYRKKKDYNERPVPVGEENDTKTKIKEPQRPATGQSEYRKKYAWQEPISNEISRSARNLEMKSSLDTKLKIYNNFMSEYQRQYRPYEYVTENRYKKMKPNSESRRITDNTNLKFVSEKVDVRRAVTPPPPQVSVKNKQYKAPDTRNPQQMSFPHGKQRRFVTEYSANYDNKWERLEAEVNRTVEEKAREANCQAKWFQEIVELRRKAQEYRARSRGTHLSREHLGQVLGGAGDARYRTDDDDDQVGRRRRAEAPRDGGRTPSPSTDRDSPRSSSSGTAEVVVGAPRRRPSPDRAAGKPTNDDSDLLDEDASHDTVLRRSTQPPPPRPRPYIIEKYLGGSDSASKSSIDGRASTARSVLSSSTMSLAVDTLDRAKRHRDQLLRQKS